MVLRVQSTAFLSFYGALLMLPLRWHYTFLMSRKIKLKYVKSTALLGSTKPVLAQVYCVISETPCLTFIARPENLDPMVTFDSRV